MLACVSVCVCVLFGVLLVSVRGFPAQKKIALFRVGGGLLIRAGPQHTFNRGRVFNHIGRHYALEGPSQSSAWIRVAVLNDLPALHGLPLRRQRETILCAISKAKGLSPHAWHAKQSISVQEATCPGSVGPSVTPKDKIEECACARDVATFLLSMPRTSFSSPRPQ